MIEVKSLTKFYGDGESRFQVLKNFMEIVRIDFRY